MKAVILAGGKGTRLGSLTEQIPKVLLPIAGKPVLDYQFEWLVREGVREVLLLTGHMTDKIREHCGDGSKWGLRISFIEEAAPLGTAGALKEAEDFLLEDFLVVYGDVLVDMDLSAFINFHCELEDPCATLMVHPNDHPHDSDLVEFDKQFRITAFHGKPHDPNRFYHNQVNAAVYILSPRIFNYLQKGVHLDLGRDVFPNLVKREKFYAYPSAEYLKDMGSPDRLAAVEADVLSGKVKRHHRRNSRPAVFLDRDGVLCHHVDFLRDLGGLVLFDDVPAALSKLNRSDFLAIVITNQPVVARGWADEAQVREIHKKMETQLGRSGARFDAIYFCPHHPDKGFPGEDMTYKITCECRKPSDGMIQEAKQFFNIDLSRSYVVGDTWRDIGVGRNAGLKKCLGVKNGVGRVGEFRDQIPDKLFLNLAEAVDFILEDSKLDIRSNSLFATAIQHEGHKGGH